MRTILELTDDIKTRCLAEHHCDPRSHLALGYAVDWLRVHPPRASDDSDILAAHCRRAVECRGRNESVTGEDWFSWDDIVRSVTGRLIDWLFATDGRCF